MDALFFFHGVKIGYRNAPIKEPYFCSRNFQHRSFCCFLFRNHTTYDESAAVKNHSAVPMAQGMNNVVYMTLRSARQHFS